MSTLTPVQLDALLQKAGEGVCVHLVGIGGCGMSGLAHMLLDLGCRVSGSDLVENEEIRQLRQREASVFIGHSAVWVREAGPVLVVRTSAVAMDNPEIVAAREAGIPVVQRALLLAALMWRQRGICVAGMHGKTTTASLLAFVMERLGLRPSYAVGALVPQLTPHARFTRVHTGARPWFVAETDESDGTLNLFQPENAILLNVDAEHLDHFPDIEAVCNEFDQFAGRVKGIKVYCRDDEALTRFMGGKPGAVSYGYHADADYRVESAAVSRPLRRADGSAGVVPADVSLVIWHKGGRLMEFTTRLMGEKNHSNVAAVVALLHQMGVDPLDMARAIPAFQGASRRQQLLYSGSNVRIYDDYGHHPNEIQATIRAFRGLAPRRLLVAFQPHRFTRTQRLMSEFATCFAGADLLWLTETYAASEPPIPGVDSAAMAGAIRARGQAVEYVPELSAVGPAVVNAIEPGDVVLFLGAGDITQVARDVAKNLEEESRVGSWQSAPTSGRTQKDDFGCALASTLGSDSLLRRDEPMAPHTTLRVGGMADFYVEPGSEEALSAVLACCRKWEVPVFILGRGSNLLVRDGGVRGVVVSLSRPAFGSIAVNGLRIQAGAGAKLKAVVMTARRHNVSGLEFLEGIPGTLGGAMRMNAGAMGAWLFHLVETVRYMDFAGNIHEMEGSASGAVYRSCPFFKTHVALGATLLGRQGEMKDIDLLMEQFSRKRHGSQPVQPSAGCIFKNTKEIPAGRLIEELGFKGKRIGGALVSEKHANFIVNAGGATARDFLSMIESIQQTAKSQRGIELETEVMIVGEDARNTAI